MSDAMHLLARLMLLLTLVLGLSLALAWAWDHSDDAAASAPHRPAVPSR